MSRTPFPTPYAGAYYPIFDDHWVEPTDKMPFNKVSALFIAFAHAYLANDNDPSDGAVLEFQRGQTDQADRVKTIMSVARQANPNIKFIISLGWGLDDWTYINDDFSGTNGQFPQTVIDFVRDYGFDIDDESIGDDPGNCPHDPYSSGCITPPNFDRAISALRSKFDEVSTQDGKPYYLTITPAFGTAHVTKENIANFDLINCQCYGQTYPKMFKDMPYPKNQISWGINTEDTHVDYPSQKNYTGLAGIFDWLLTSDSANYEFKYTNQIAHDVGYPPRG